MSLVDDLDDFSSTTQPTEGRHGDGARPALNYKLYFFAGGSSYNIRVSNVLDHPVNINIGK